MLYCHAVGDFLSLCLLVNGSLAHYFFFFFFNDTATTEIYTLSLHDALPIFGNPAFSSTSRRFLGLCLTEAASISRDQAPMRSEEHTSELQSQSNLVCRLLLEKKKQNY